MLDPISRNHDGKTEPRARPRTDRFDIPDGALRVLVADDEHLVATGLASSLRELGHEVIGVAPDGEAALRMAREHLPAVALLDIRMPRMDGIDAAAAIAAELGIPSVIVSAYSDQEHLDRIRSRPDVSGVFGYLLKPVDKHDLRVAIGVAVQCAAVGAFRERRIAQLEQNLANRRVVEQAKWLMVEKHGLSEAQAHERLQRVARDQRRQLVEVAQSVIASGELP